MRRSFVELSLNVSVVLVALLVVIAALSVSGAEECKEIHATHEPQDGLRRGAKYTVYCKFDNVTNPCDIKKMAFGLWNNTDLNPQVRQMPDGSGIYVEMYEAEPKYISSFPFECQYNNHTVYSEKFPIGELLQVKDFACKYVYYEDRDMFCSFTRPEKSYDADPNTTYKLHHKNTLVECETNDTDPLVQCTLPGASFTRNIDGTLKFRLVMNDTVGVQETKFNMSQKEIATPINAGINAIEMITTNSICLEWENKNIIEDVTWQVHIMEEPQWQLERDFRWVTMNASKNLLEAFCLTGLPHPYREYTLNVSRKFANATHWSEPFIYKFTTQPDIPSRPPTLWNGGYQYVDENHQLVIYWQQLEHLERNGPNYNNQVSVPQLSESEVQKLKIVVEVNWATIDNLPIGGGQYEILVYSQNSVGKSKNSSRILIGELEKSAQRRPKLIERNKEKGNISWPSPENAADVSHYMVFWCIENESNHSQCLNSTRIAAEKVPKGHNYYVNPNITNDSFKWAVSAIYAEVSGGMVWYSIHGEQSTTSTAFHGIEGVVALLILGGFGYIAFRKFRDCSDIGIEFPEGVFSNQDNKDNEQHPMLSMPGRSVQFTDIPLPGSVTPGTPPLGLHISAKPGSPPLGTDTFGTPSGSLLAVTIPKVAPPVSSSGNDTLGNPSFALPQSPSGYVIPARPAKPATLGLPLPATPGTPPGSLLAVTIPDVPPPVSSSGTDTLGIPSFALPQTPSGYVVPARPAKPATFGLPPTATPGTPPGSLLAVTIPDVPPPVSSSGTDTLGIPSFALPQTPSGYVVPARPAKPATFGLPPTATPGTPPGSLLAVTIPDVPPPVSSSGTDTLGIPSFALPQTRSGYVVATRPAMPATLGDYVHVDTVKSGTLSNSLPGIPLPGTTHALPPKDYSVACDYVPPVTGKPATPPAAPIVSTNCEYVDMKVLESRKPSLPQTHPATPGTPAVAPLGSDTVQAKVVLKPAGNGYVSMESVVFRKSPLS